jgi:hypothetical protein
MSASQFLRIPSHSASLYNIPSLHSRDFFNRLNCNMRLIHTTNRELSEFFGSKIPGCYAILSHTWDDGQEVSYKQYTDGGYQYLRGHSKIDNACKLAAANGIDWIWVDTCCIDKSSSAELSEAINSMFRWYQRSYVCYVHLADLPAEADWGTELRKCRW